VVEKREVKFESARVGVAAVEQSAGNGTRLEFGQFTALSCLFQVEGLLSALLESPHLSLVLLALETRTRAQFRLLQSRGVRILSALEVAGSLTA
jgi:hypothetical protein